MILVTPTHLLQALRIGACQFRDSHITRTPFSNGGDKALVTHVIKAKRDEFLIQAIDIERLFPVLANPDQPLPMPESLQLLAAA